MAQDLVRELLTFLWCMKEHNLSTLMLLPSINAVNPSAPLPASGDPRDFPTILVCPVPTHDWIYPPGLRRFAEPESEWYLTCDINVSSS